MSILSRFRAVLRLVGHVEGALAIAALVSIVGIILMQVSSRYVFGRPLIWAEEMATYLLIWLGFFAASVALKLQRHVVIRTFDAFVGNRIRRLTAAGAYAVVAMALAAVILHVPAAMRTEALKSTVGLPVNVGLHWFFSVPTIVCCVSMAVTALYYVAASLTGDARPLLTLPSDPSLDEDIGLDAEGAQP